MLKEKKLLENTILAIKLTTGEEIIAKVLSYGSRDLKVSKPLAMVMAENPENPAQTRVMFTPWMVAAGSDSISIDQAHIVATASARKDAEEQYLAAIKE